MVVSYTVQKPQFGQVLNSASDKITKASKKVEVINTLIGPQTCQRRWRHPLSVLELGYVY